MELTKEYFDEQLKNLATKEELKAQTGTINGRFDGIEQRFLELPTRQDYAALKSSVDDIQAKVTRIDERTDEDTRAALKDIVKLQSRVTALEQKLKLQTN
jgi:predicted secreted Zn-dependent protease